jgi:hypothetical protein
LRGDWAEILERREREIFVGNLERESSNENEYFGTFCP